MPEEVKPKDDGIFKPDDQVDDEKPVIDGEDVPEAFKGKTWKEVQNLQAEAKQKEEEARKEAEEAKKEVEILKRQSFTQPPVQTQTTVTPPPERPFNEAIWDNPEEAVTKTIEKKLEEFRKEAAPYITSSGESSVLTQKLELRTKIGEERYLEYETRINEKLAPLPSNLKGQPGAVNFIYRALRSEDLDKLEDEHKKRQEEALILKGTDTAGATPGQPVGSGREDPRDDEQKKVDARFGIGSAKERKKWDDKEMTIPVKED